LFQIQLLDCDMKQLGFEVRLTWLTFLITAELE